MDLQENQKAQRQKSPKMQRAIEEIVEWNLKKIDSDIGEFRLQLNEIRIKARACQLDMSKTSPILNNIMITVDSLQEDAQRILQRCQVSEDAVKFQEQKTETSSGEPKTQGCISSPFEPHVDPDQTVYLDQMPFNISQRLKKVEEVLFSQNVNQRLEKVENLQSSSVQRLEVIEKFRLPMDLPERVTKVEADVLPLISNRLDTTETQLKGMVKGVSGLKDSFQENCMRLGRVEEKVNAYADQKGFYSHNFIHFLILVFLSFIFYIMHNIKE